VKPIDKGVIIELPDLVDAFIPASQFSITAIRNLSEFFKPGDMVKAEIIEFDKTNKKIVLSVIEYLKDKEQKEVDEYIAKYKLPKKFTVKDIAEKTRSYEAEHIDFRIEDIIGDELSTVNTPPVQPPVIQVPPAPPEITEQKEIIPEQKEIIPEQKEIIPEQKEIVSEQKEIIPEQKEIIPEQKEINPEQKEISPEQNV
jgi:small subunit ribosomal protein S1